MIKEFWIKLLSMIKVIIKPSLGHIVLHLDNSFLDEYASHFEPKFETDDRKVIGPFIFDDEPITLTTYLYF